MNDFMLIYVAIGLAGVFLAIVAAANMYWGSKMDTKTKRSN